MFAVQTIKSQAPCPGSWPRSYCRESLFSRTSPLMWAGVSAALPAPGLSTDSSSLCSAIMTCCTARVAPSEDRDWRLSTFMLTGVVIVTTAPAADWQNVVVTIQISAQEENTITQLGAVCLCELLLRPLCVFGMLNRDLGNCL